MSQEQKESAASKIPASILDHKLVLGGAAAAVFLIAGLIFYFVDFIPSLSHLNVELLSGSSTGNYYAVADRAVKTASQRRGTIRNVATNGSVDNIEKVSQAASSGVFALVQNGLPWPPGVQLVAHLPSHEIVFFLGRGADRIDSISDLRGMEIGAGPKGSGSAYLTESIFNIPALKALGVKLSYHTNDEQLQLLKSGKLDLGVFVISEKSAFIEKALLEDGMQIAGFREIQSLIQRLPFLKARQLDRGVFDPVRGIPSTSKSVLELDTLLITNQKAKRSQIVGMLTVMSDLMPNLLQYNRTVANETGLAQVDEARDFFAAQGPEIFDRYIPRLMDIIPISNLVQIGLVISVIFNLMGMGNRFFLWRIDANRLIIESEIESLFEANLLPEEIETLEPIEAHKSGPGLERLSAIIHHLSQLENRSRRQSQSILVPMGAEMAYRYQERLISANLIALKVYRTNCLKKG